MPNLPLMLVVRCFFSIVSATFTHPTLGLLKQCTIVDQSGYSSTHLYADNTSCNRCFSITFPRFCLILASVFSSILRNKPIWYHLCFAGKSSFSRTSRVILSGRKKAFMIQRWTLSWINMIILLLYIITSIILCVSYNPNVMTSVRLSILI